MEFIPRFSASPNIFYRSQKTKKNMTAGVVPWCWFSPWRLFSCSTDTPTAWTESVLLSPSTEFYALHQAHILHRFFMGHCTHQLNFGASPLIQCLGQSTVGLATPLVQELWEHFIIQDGVRLRPLHLHHACININFCSQDSSRLPSSHGYSDLYAHFPMHSIHVDHGIHTISSRLMAAMHIFLWPPLPLLSLSPGYFPRTKGSGLPTPQFFFFF
jgi:hypothetical protein